MLPIGFKNLQPFASLTKTEIASYLLYCDLIANQINIYFKLNNSLPTELKVSLSSLANHCGLKNKGMINLIEKLNEIETLTDHSNNKTIINVFIISSLSEHYNNRIRQGGVFTKFLQRKHGSSIVDNSKANNSLAECRAETPKLHNSTNENINAELLKSYSQQFIDEHIEESLDFYNNEYERKDKVPLLRFLKNNLKAKKNKYGDDDFKTNEQKAALQRIAEL
jgi:hypothetical protein